MEQRKCKGCEKRVRLLFSEVDYVFSQVSEPKSEILVPNLVTFSKQEGLYIWFTFKAGVI